jgi:pimeloyl-ACP methyl ester carboxylesterase
MGSTARPVALALALALVWLIAAASRAQEAEAGSPVQAEKVTFASEDGVSLHGDLYASSDPEAPTVVLLHAHRKDRTSWAALIPDLTRAGINVLNLDLRGHGESPRKGEAVLDANDIPIFLTTTLIVDSTKDVVAALRFLQARKIQIQRVALVGDTYGAMVSFLAAGVAPAQVRTLVLLSPPQAGWGINVRAHAQWFPGRILAIVDKDDPIAAPGTKLIIDLHPGDDALLVYTRGGRGTALLETYPEVRPRIVEYVKRTLDGG